MGGVKWESPNADPMNDMSGQGGAPGGRGGMHGGPMQPHELMENVDEYGMDAKRRRY